MRESMAVKKKKRKRKEENENNITNVQIRP